MNRRTKLSEAALSASTVTYAGVIGAIVLWTMDRIARGVVHPGVFRGIALGGAGLVVKHRQQQLRRR